jgi:hypothetical protein
VVDSPAPGSAVRSRDALSRRTLLAAGAGAAALAASACSTDDSGAVDSAPRASAELAPDVAVATSALSEIRAVRTAVAGTLSRFPAVRASLAPLAQLHQAHEGSLANAVPQRARPSVAPAPYVVPRKREVALANLAVREQRLHDTLDGLALRAQSGEFARLLASMGAAISQRLAVFER